MNEFNKHLLRSALGRALYWMLKTETLVLSLSSLAVRMEGVCRISHRLELTVV